MHWRLRGFVKAELFTGEQAEAMYAAGQAAEGEQAAGHADDGVVDAEFEEVDEHKS